MTFRFPAGFISLRDGHERAASAFSPGSKVTTDQRRSAASRLREAIFRQQLELYAMLSPGPPIRLLDAALLGPPIRLLDAALFEEAFFTEKEVLTFNHIVRHRTRRFGLCWQDLKKLSRDPLCLDENTFRKWLRQEVRKSARAHNGAGSAPPGRRPEKRSEGLKAIEQLDAQGRLEPGMGNKEVHALVQKLLPSLEISRDTVRRARNQFAEKKVRRRKPRITAKSPRQK